MKILWFSALISFILFSSGGIMGYLLAPEGKNVHTFHVQRLFIQLPCEDPDMIAEVRWN